MKLHVNIVNATYLGSNFLETILNGYVTLRSVNHCFIPLCLMFVYLNNKNTISNPRCIPSSIFANIFPTNTFSGINCQLTDCSYQNTLSNSNVLLIYACAFVIMNSSPSANCESTMNKRLAKVFKGPKWKFKFMSKAGRKRRALILIEIEIL